MGSVFQLVPSGNGDWTENILHSFPDFPGDGDDLNGRLAIDASGNLFGVTSNGGTEGYGTIFQLLPGTNGWTQQVLYNFSCCEDGHNPYAGPILGSDGNLYGTTSGVVYEFVLGSWNYDVLNVFCSQPGCTDGVDAFSSAIRDSAGHLFGTTEKGGTQNWGTVYVVGQTQSGTWKEAVLHSFPSFNGDGGGPGTGQLAMDARGNLYGTTVIGGAHKDGTIYKLAPGHSGWTETVLYNFEGNNLGYDPSGGVILDKLGNIYGTTVYGGSPVCQCGVVYRLTPQSNGKWQYTVLHTFVGTDGAQPDANLTLGPDGNLYGTTATGGPKGEGVVLQISLPRPTAR